MPKAAAPKAPTTAFVVGGAGFVGSHLVDRLVVEATTVHVIDDLSTGSLSNLAAARSTNSLGRLVFQQLDATTPQLGEYLERHQPDVLYVLSAMSARWSAPQAVLGIALMVNVLESVRLRSPGTKVIVTLPASILYGDVPVRELPAKEDRGFRPMGATGVMAESIVHLLQRYRDEHSIEFTALLTSTIYGPRQRSEANVVAAALQARRDGTAFTLHGDGRQTRDFVYVEDAAEALFRAASKGGGLVINLGSGTGTSIRDLWKLVGGDQPVRAGARRALDANRVVLSPSRARLHLGWSAWTTLANGLEASLDSAE
ncbi:MAG: UDP-glucose 4-epimerase [Actinomycetota bacterium]